MQNPIDQSKKKLEELERRLADPSVTSNPAELTRLGKEHQKVQRLVGILESHASLEKEISELEEIERGGDSTLAEVARQELADKRKHYDTLSLEIEEALSPKDPKDQNSAILEIRAGAGGDEAGLFAAELFRMYGKYAESKGWGVSIDSTNRTGIGGYKEVIAEIQGDGAYGDLKFESGVHRVQRVPDTEKSGRVHTSTVTVAVLPVVEEQEFALKPEDLKIEVTTSSGHGGQSVNTTYSAIRMTHIPTGIIVSCQDERSQKQNKEKAMQIMRSRVYAYEQEKKQKELSQQRLGQIGTGDRSEKIRTYNFPQDRVTDHRIKATFHNISSFMEGGIDALLSLLKQASRNASHGDNANNT